MALVECVTDLQQFQRQMLSKSTQNDVGCGSEVGDPDIDRDLQGIQLLPPDNIDTLFRNPDSQHKGKVALITDDIRPHGISLWLPSNSTLKVWLITCTALPARAFRYPDYLVNKSHLSRESCEDSLPSCLSNHVGH